MMRVSDNSDDSVVQEETDSDDSVREDSSSTSSSSDGQDATRSPRTSRRGRGRGRAGRGSWRGRGRGRGRGRRAARTEDLYKWTVITGGTHKLLCMHKKILIFIYLFFNS